MYLQVSTVAFQKLCNDLKRALKSRAKSPTPAFRAAADTPMLFAEIRQPDTTYLVIPEVSSERRRYVPIGYIEQRLLRQTPYMCC